MCVPELFGTHRQREKVPAPATARHCTELLSLFICLLY